MMEGGSLFGVAHAADWRRRERMTRSLRSLSRIEGGGRDAANTPDLVVGMLGKSRWSYGRKKQVVVVLKGCGCGAEENGGTLSSCCPTCVRLLNFLHNFGPLSGWAREKDAGCAGNPSDLSSRGQRMGGISTGVSRSLFRSSRPLFTSPHVHLCRCTWSHVCIYRHIHLYPSLSSQTPIHSFLRSPGRCSPLCR